MAEKILTVYKSVTGFTKEYAELIAREIDCPLMNFKDVTAETMSGYETVIFGGRMHAGTVDGLNKAKELFQKSRASRLIIFATGATPNSAAGIIEEMWSHNLSPDELRNIPHFYMQSGLRYEKMPLGDRLMMKVFCSMMKKKKDKTEAEKQMADAISDSFDISSEVYAGPLIEAIRSRNLVSYIY